MLSRLVNVEFFFLSKSLYCLKLSNLFSKRFLFTLLSGCWLNTFLIFGQEATDQIVPPLDIPLLLSGTFGELRGSHIHAGMDIKTQGREGLPVRAFWGGNINRIAVRTSGYGKALYVEHPNGKTTVYAHLKKFAPKIQAYVKEHQYKKKTFTLQLYPNDETLKVTPGEVIGFSGNTGGSFGPHLHFEVRDSDTQQPINPLQYALNIKDHQRPQIKNLYLYNHRKNRKVKKQYPIFKKHDSLYTTSVIKTAGTISVGINAFDRQDLSYNKNGVYQIAVWLNGVKKFERLMDRFSFDDSNSIGLIMDLNAKKTAREKIEHLWIHPKNKASFYQESSLNGSLEILPGKSYLISVFLSDFNQNQTQLDIYVMGNNSEYKTPIIPREGKEIMPELDYIFPFEHAEVYIPKNSFYDPQFLSIKASNDTLFLDQDRLHLRNPITIEFSCFNLTDEEKKQTTIASVIKDKNYFIPTKRTGNVFGASIKSLGTYTLVKDTIAPKLSTKNFKANQSINRYQFLTFVVEDEFSDIAKYTGFINNQWILLEYEPKRKTLTYDLSDLQFETEKLEIEVIVEDGVGNETRLNTSVFLK